MGVCWSRFVVFCHSSTGDRSAPNDLAIYAGALGKRERIPGRGGLGHCSNHRRLSLDWNRERSRSLRRIELPAVPASEPRTPSNRSSPGTVADAEANLWILLKNTKILRYHDGKFE